MKGVDVQVKAPSPRDSIAVFLSGADWAFIELATAQQPYPQGWNKVFPVNGLHRTIFSLLFTTCFYFPSQFQRLIIFLGLLGKMDAVIENIIRQMNKKIEMRSNYSIFKENEFSDSSDSFTLL
ncbi:hypothetical protein KQX54_019259 [Cotesia glomerata]|uniref:Uncharacterized protein n=1 Tax=Cotesia glomerata TaxID=32391 RepID=A0AAV7J201_COTGL|nr:hypothetical protein KQX54_019259 [Cotesia glomerata]